jgi:GDPmannose 4,6-dehydratase
MASKSALITGITGQDGTYLSALLLAKGYDVHGLVRQPGGGRETAGGALDARVVLHPGDLTDSASLTRLVAELEPDEIYNLGAQSHVGLSFVLPEHTFDCNAGGTLRLLEAIRAAGLTARTRFYQASSSEMFGLAVQAPQNEHTPFRPRSPYAISKLAAHWQTVMHREAYGLFGCCGILFNHESPRRGTQFVSRRISLGLSRIVAGVQDELLLGNLEARRDWGHARDYVEAQWRMLQQPAAADYVIATGEQYSVRDFADAAAAELGMRLEWQGAGMDEVGRIASAPPGAALLPGRVLVRVDARQLRPAEVPTLRGDATLAAQTLDWRPSTPFRALVAEMVAHDLALARREAQAA